MTIIASFNNVITSKLLYFTPYTYTHNHPITEIVSVSLLKNTQNIEQIFSAAILTFSL